MLNLNRLNQSVYEKKRSILSVQEEMHKQGVLFSSNEAYSSIAGQNNLWGKRGYNEDTSDRIVFSERIISNVENISFLDPLTGPLKIKGSEDVAFIFKNLESSVSENVFAVFVDKNENYRVLYISTGSSVSSIMDIKSICSAAKHFNSTGVYIVHNHPSGSLIASDADITATKNVKKSLESINVQLLGSLIINLDSGKYAVIDLKTDRMNMPIFQRITPNDVRKVSIYCFDKQQLYIPSNERHAITEPKDIAVFLSKQKRGTVQKSSIIYLNANLNVTCCEFLDEHATKAEIVKKIVSNTGFYGERVALVSNCMLNARDVKFIKDKLDSANIILLDVLTFRQDKEIIDACKSVMRENSHSVVNEKSQEIVYHNPDDDIILDLKKLCPDARKITLKANDAFLNGGSYSSEKYASDMKKLGYKIEIDVHSGEVIFLSKTERKVNKSYKQVLARKIK